MKHFAAMPQNMKYTCGAETAPFSLLLQYRFAHNFSASVFVNNAIKL